MNRISIRQVLASLAAVAFLVAGYNMTTQHVVTGDSAGYFCYGMGLLAFALFAPTDERL